MFRQIEKKLVVSCLRMLARPVVKFCVRYGVPIQDFVECCKELFVEAAVLEIEASGEQVTTSRVSVITGMHRRDAKRLLEADQSFELRIPISTRVMGQWQNDRRFVTQGGKPRVLSYGKEDSEFHELVASVSKDLNPATVLFELERVASVKRTPRGLKLAVASYVPKGNIEEGFKILAADVADFVSSVEENVLREDLAVSHLHARTEYDRVRPQHLPEIRRWLIKEGNALHQRARNFISKFDQDINPKEGFTEKGARVVLSAYSFVDDRESDASRRNSDQ